MYRSQEVFGLPKPPRCEVQFRGGAGYGTVNTKIPYFTTQTFGPTGSAFAVRNNSITGCEIFILAEGVYDVHLGVDYGSLGVAAGITLNSSELTTGVDSLTDVTKLRSYWISNQGGANYLTEGHTAISCVPGDVIRPHLQGTALTGTNASKMLFRVTKIA